MLKVILKISDQISVKFGDDVKRNLKQMRCHYNAISAIFWVLFKHFCNNDQI